MKKITRKSMSIIWLMVALVSVIAFASGCYPLEGPETTPQQGGGTASIAPLIIFLVLIFGFMYFAVIRPQRKRQREQQQMVQALKRGDQVITSGGIYGVVETVSDDSILIKVESGATMRVAKGSVAVRRER